MQVVGNRIPNVLQHTPGPQYLLGERMGSDIQMVSLSLEPEVDTPAKLKRYWEAFGSREG